VASALHRSVRLTLGLTTDGLVLTNPINFRLVGNYRPISSITAYRNCEDKCMVLEGRPSPKNKGLQSDVLFLSEIVIGVSISKYSYLLPGSIGNMHSIRNS
jgi:hypothetical protein